MTMWRKKKSIETIRATQPIPLVSAIGRNPIKTKNWEIKESASYAAYTDLIHGVMSVPLTDKNEPCKLCKTPNHNDAVRTHELIHARISPDNIQSITLPEMWIKEAIKNPLNEIRTLQLIKNESWKNAIYPKDPKTDKTIPSDYHIVAEEYLVEKLHTRLNNREQHKGNYICLPNYKKTIIQLLEENKIKEAIFISVSTGFPSTVGNLLLKLSRGTYLKSNKIKNKEAIKEYAKEIHTLANTLHRIYDITTYVNYARTGRANLTSGRANLTVLLYLYTHRLENENKELNPLKNLKEEGLIDDDLEKMIDRVPKYSNNTGNLEDFANELKHKLNQTESDETNPIKWGDMDIETPVLNKRMPVWKTQRLRSPADEGTIPTYMHRYAVDHKVFRRTTKQYGASVLIDDSGSMGWTAKQIDNILIKIPGVIIGVYAGRGGAGILRIVAKDGKRVEDPQDLKIPMGGNQIDKPALEWLASQVEPRIWVSDGQVVSVSHGYTREAVQDCLTVVIKNKINRAETATEAYEMLTGKKELYR